ncbi:MAG: hypothetical protein LBS54_09600 [Dysgonamonadaceae bacterium]|jgi:hypothetical protein|nr:hypothetical protein [Dysgonamonadaceae bacterium]
MDLKNDNIGTENNTKESKINIYNWEYTVENDQYYISDEIISTQPGIYFTKTLQYFFKELDDSCSYLGDSCENLRYYVLHIPDLTDPPLGSGNRVLMFLDSIRENIDMVLNCAAVSQYYLDDPANYAINSAHSIEILQKAIKGAYIQVDSVRGYIELMQFIANLFQICIDRNRPYPDERSYTICYDPAPTFRLFHDDKYQTNFVVFAYNEPRTLCDAQRTLRD